MASSLRTISISNATRRSVARASQGIITPLQRRLAHQDYGSGEGNPVGEKPQEQGANPSADKEHPGPPPPKAGYQSGGSPTKGSPEGHNTSSTKSPQQKRGFSTARTLWADSNKSSSSARPKTTKGLSPKILSESPPRAEDEPEDVKEHNRDMENRAERPHEQISNDDAEKDKVSSKYWSGHGGVDRQP